MRHHQDIHWKARGTERTHSVGVGGQRGPAPTAERHINSSGYRSPAGKGRQELTPRACRFHFIRGAAEPFAKAGDGLSSLLVSGHPIARLDNRRGHACRRIELRQNCAQHHVPAKFADAAKAVHVCLSVVAGFVEANQPRRVSHCAEQISQGLGNVRCRL